MDEHNVPTRHRRCVIEDLFWDKEKYKHVSHAQIVRAMTKENQKWKTSRPFLTCFVFVHKDSYFVTMFKDDDVDGNY